MTLRFLVPAACLGFALTSPVDARPPHKQALANHIGPLLAKPLNDCRTCHVPGPATDEDKPHNPFGKRLAAVRDELKDAGKKTDVAARLDAVADEDADGDGASNLVELLTGYFPGDPADKPSAADLAAVKEKLAAFARHRSAYPWRPFETVQRPAVPSIRNPQSAIRNPIDAFIAREHQERGLTPRPEANKATLLRRVYLDLVGLPPSPEEMEAFLNDPAPDAYERVVDRLLNSPRHGERWGRHWMDVWRYSDWAGWGNQVRDSQPHVWRWRDWIVESLNADKGYDRMLLEMLAGDEIAPEDPDTLRATGYLVRNFKLLSRETWMQDVVDHTFQAFQGVTLACARCHDHMFDPIPQADYYRVRAIFEPHKVRLDRLPGEADVAKAGVARAYDADPKVDTFLFVRGDDRTPDKSKPVGPGVPAALGGAYAVKPVPLPPTAYMPDRRDFVVAETQATLRKAIEPARIACRNVERNLMWAGVFPTARPFEVLGSLATLGAYRNRVETARLDVRLAELKSEVFDGQIQLEQMEDAGRKDSPEWTEAATSVASLQRQERLFQARRGLLAAEGTPLPVQAKARETEEKRRRELAAALSKAEAEATQPPTTAYVLRTMTNHPPVSTGRRLALGRWLTDRANPLTARVAVNHVWLRHFGQALVPSVFDFGRNGRAPSHPALVDWLADELMANGWALKHVHRLIVTSSTYRQASTPDAANEAKDRDVVYLWRMPSRRLEAEVVRDLLFHVAGRLDGRMGGPELPQTDGLIAPRRSLYFRHAAEKQMEFLKLFDCAAVTECYQRKESVVPQQSLALLNSPLAIRHARIFARNLGAKVGSDPAAFVRAAFLATLSRSPTDAELAECVAFLERQSAAHAAATKGGPPAGATADSQPSPDPVVRARENLALVLFNHHEFVTVR